MTEENSPSISSCKQNLTKQLPLFYRNRRREIQGSEKVGEMIEGNKHELETVRKRNERKTNPYLEVAHTINTYKHSKEYKE